MAYRSFEDLEVWKASCQLAVDVYEIFKNSRDYVMRDQILRSSLSIPSNIAEEMERDSARDSSRFLHIAKGSAAEVRTQLYLATRMKMISSDQSAPLLVCMKKISGQLQALVNSLKPKL